MTKLFFFLAIITSIMPCTASETSEHGRLSDYLMDKLMSWHYKNIETVKANYNSLLEQKFRRGIIHAKDPVYDPICKIEWTRTNGNPLSHGTGALICHPQNPQRKAILTNAHVVDKKDATCAVTFTIDGIARKVVGTPIILDRKENGYGIDLALLELEDYPDLKPLQRSCDDIQLNANIFGHTAGYGYFYSHYEGDDSMGVIYDNLNFKHTISGTYQMGNDPEGENKILFDMLNENSKQEREDCMGKTYLLSKHPETTTVEHPVTKSPYPCAPAEAGFSGSPLLNTDDEIIAISARGQWESVGKYRPCYLYYPYLSHLYSIYVGFSRLSNGYFLGEKAHYTSNFVGCGLLSMLIHDLWKARWTMPLLKCISKSFVGPFALLSIWKLTNTLGGVIERFCDGFTPFTVVKSGQNYSLSIPIAPWNQKIDEELMKMKIDKESTDSRSL